MHENEDYHCILIPPRGYTYEFAERYHLAEKLTTMVEAPSPDVIMSLLQTSTYDPSIVPQLEAFVKAEADVSAAVPYNPLANRTLMKFLHQFFPSNREFHADGLGVTALVLFLALEHNYSDGTPGSSSSAGRNDFFALTCIIPETAQSEEPCATLIQ